MFVVWRSIVKRETRPCVRCGVSITKRPSHFQTTPDKTYCGVKCRNLANLAKIDPAKRNNFKLNPPRRPEPLRDEAHPNWKGDVAQTITKRRRAVRRYKLDKCELCGAKATDRHHKDGDTGNNAPSNVQFLCRRCHMIVDGRLEKFVERAKQFGFKAQPPKPCQVCGRSCKPRTKGRCGACYAYFRAHGRDRQSKIGSTRQSSVYTRRKQSNVAAKEQPCS